jgi:hypothetical protein
MERQVSHRPGKLYQLKACYLNTLSSFQ